MTEKTYHVLWSEAAAGDVEAIATYIASDSPARARRLLERLEKKAASLRVVPERGRIIPEMARFGWREWRELIVRPYRIMCRVEGRSVHVAAVLDGRRDIEELLLERLTRVDR
jgi:plasmid stabilization system protein ParE